MLCGCGARGSPRSPRSPAREMKPEASPVFTTSQVAARRGPIHVMKAPGRVRDPVRHLPRGIPMRSLKLTSLLFALAVSAAASACGGSSAPATSRATPKTASDANDPSCPMVVPGTSVTVEDTATGAALVFVTTGDVAEVRRRVASLAQMHNEHHGAMGPLPDGSGGGGHEGHEGHGAAAGGGGKHAGHDMGGGGGHEGH